MPVMAKGAVMADETTMITLRDGGRIVIPASIRAALGLKTGDTLIARVEDGELRLTSRAEALRRLQTKIRAWDRGSGSVVDEFLAERRAEAARE
jgi:AbrB family looped-hinge helix DNA binding protein